MWALHAFEHFSVPINCCSNGAGSFQSKGGIWFKRTVPSDFSQTQQCRACSDGAIGYVEDGSFLSLHLQASN